jgi:hypothetical protein
MSFITLTGILMVLSASIYATVTLFEREKHGMDLDWGQYHACNRLLGVIKWIGIAGFITILFSLI